MEITDEKVGDVLDMSVFGNRLRELRNEKKITGEKLGKILNVSKNSISNYENENRMPNFDILIHIASYFNVTTDYLLGNSNTRNYEDLSKKITEKLIKANLLIENPSDMEIEEIINDLKKHLMIKNLFNKN